MFNEDQLIVLAEEILFISYDPMDLSNRAIIIDSTSYNLNLRTIHDTLYPPAVSGTIITCTIIAGVVVGSTLTSNPAFDVGSWPAGVIINLVVQGRIEGRGGDGGQGSGHAGANGGTALYTRFAISVDFTAAQIWAGGGGGGGGGSKNGGGGGGAAGSLPGYGGGLAGTGGTPGTDGTLTTGGSGGAGGGSNSGGNGGGPGLDGTAGNAGGINPGGAKGIKGNAIDGVSLLTITGTGDRRGTEIN